MRRATALICFLLAALLAPVAHAQDTARVRRIEEARTRTVFDRGPDVPADAAPAPVVVVEPARRTANRAVAGRVRALVREDARVLQRQLGAVPSADPYAGRDAGATVFSRERIRARARTSGCASGCHGPRPPNGRTRGDPLARELLRGADLQGLLTGRLAP